jgi:hypothetical protein
MSDEISRWLSGFAPSSAFDIRKNRQRFGVHIHSPTYGSLVLCPHITSPMQARRVRQYENTIPNMKWLSIDHVRFPPPHAATKDIVYGDCAPHLVYGMLCSVYGRDNLYGNACVVWMNTYARQLYNTITRHTNQNRNGSTNKRRKEISHLGIYTTTLRARGWYCINMLKSVFDNTAANG